MPSLLRVCAFTVLALSGIGLPSLAQAGRVVHVTLQDASEGGGVQGMRMTADPAVVAPGPVTIVAANRSRALVHEVIVVRATGRPLPYDRKADRVIEARIHSLGEVDDLKPGATGSLRVVLRPGSYLLFCNQPGHYQAGMWTRLKVGK